MAVTRHLIVNGDDFGRSRRVNAGIMLAHEHGILTSASLMVRWPSSAEAANYARATSGLSVGLHLDLGEWRYTGDNWELVYRVVDDHDPAAVQVEVDRQLQTFWSLVGRPPTHLDSHQHVHRSEPVRSALLAAGQQLGIPVRECTDRVRHVGVFHGQDGRGNPYPQGISRGHLIGTVRALPDGVSEVGCHPASEPELGSTYADERPMELRVLCDPAVGAALEDEGIELCNFLTAPTQVRAPIGGINA